MVVETVLGRIGKKESRVEKKFGQKEEERNEEF